MPVPSTICVAEIKYEKVLALGLNPKLKPRVPMESGPEPKLVDKAVMDRLSPPVLFDRTFGYTEPIYWYRFESPQPFKKDSAGLWQFQGGRLYLQAAVTVYLDQQYADPSGKFKYRGLFYAIAMSHELDHVQDEIDIATKLLPDALKADKNLGRFLFDDGSGQPAKVSQNDYDLWFTQRGGYEDYQGVSPTQFEYTLLNLWATLHNAKCDSTDTDTRHTMIEQKLQSLRGGSGEYVTWP